MVYFYRNLLLGEGTRLFYGLTQTEKGAKMNVKLLPLTVYPDFLRTVMYLRFLDLLLLLYYCFTSTVNI